MWSSAAAVEFGLPYRLRISLVRCIRGMRSRAYKRNFRQVDRPGARTKPEATVAVGVICAETQEEAEYLAQA